MARTETLSVRRDFFPGIAVFLRRLAAIACPIAFVAASPPAAAPPSFAAQPVRLSFVPHAAFFSVVTHQSSLVDPEIYVAAPNAPAALGFAQIAHVAGERSAEMRDDAGAQALDANARPLGFDLQHWFAANGVVEVTAPDPDRGNTQSVILRFANLVPRARYSVFVAHSESHSTSIGPLDGMAKTNSFTTDGDGSAGATIVSPEPLPHGSAILLVYHADHKDHGVREGNAGFDAFDQLVVTIP